MTDVLISPLLDRYLLDDADERTPDGLYHPSSLFGCDRQAVYQVRGTEVTDPKVGADHRPLKVGKLLHELLQMAVTHEAGQGGRIVRAWHEVKVTIPTLRITGSADSLVELRVTDDDGNEWTEYEVEEFKSTKSIALKYAKKDGYPKKNHVGQVLTYLYGMRHFPFVTEYVDEWGVTITESHQPLGGALRKARITYIGKDSADIHEFPVETSPEWELSLETYIKGLELYREDGEALPFRLARDDDGKKNWLCGYCAFRTRCWSTDGEGVELNDDI